MVEFEEFCEFGEDSLAEHFEAVASLRSYIWIGRGGKIVDLRKAKVQHIQRLAEWMEKNDTDNTPYKSLTQYIYVQKRIQRNQQWLNLAKGVLKSKC